MVKIYRALVAGKMPANRKKVDHPIEGAPAHTIIKLLDAGRTASHLRIRIETGRTHQIRKHLALLGHPVLGDKQYFTRPIRSARLRRTWLLERWREEENTDNGDGDEVTEDAD